MTESEQNVKLKSVELALSAEMQKLRLMNIEPKREHFGTMNSSLERNMIKASENGKLLDPLKQSEYKSYLKGQNFTVGQNHQSNRKINKNSTIVSNIKSATSALSEINCPNSQQNWTFDNRPTLTNRDGSYEGLIDKTPTKYASK